MLNISNDRTQFGTRYIGPASVKAKIKHRWRDVDVNVIKFETNLGKELNCIEALKYLWSGKNLSASIAEEARICGGASNVYAITSQERKLDKIEPSKILGVMTTGKIKKGEPTVEVYKIGVNPKYAYEQNKKSRELKHIATALIDAFAKKARKSGVEPIVSFAEPGEEKFLSKVGLKPQCSEIVEIIGK